MLRPNIRAAPPIPALCRRWIRPMCGIAGINTATPFDPARLEAAVAAALRNYTGDVAVMSFNPHAIAHMARLAPNVARGITTSAYDPIDWHPLPLAACDALRDIPDYDRTLSSFISHEAGDLARPRVSALRAQGAAVLCWTIRSAQAEAEARKIAQNITFEGYAA